MAFSKTHGLIAGAVGAVMTIAGALATADSHWARAADVRAIAEGLSKQIEVSRLSAEVSSLENRRAAVQDKVFDARARRTRSIGEQAITQRYENDLKFLEQQIRDKQRQIDALRGKP